MLESSAYNYLYQRGFTLIELMIVVAIMGLLVSIAIPSYSKLNIKANDDACIAEAKAYSNEVFLAINDQEIFTLPIAPTLHSCRDMTDATGWTLDTQQVITATSKSSSASRILCDIPNGNPCKVLP